MGAIPTELDRDADELTLPILDHRLRGVSYNAPNYALLQCCQSDSFCFGIAGWGKDDGLFTRPDLSI